MVLWFVSEMFLKGSCVEGTVAIAAMLGDGDLGKVIRHDGTDIMNGLVRW